MYSIRSLFLLEKNLLGILHSEYLFSLSWYKENRFWHSASEPHSQTNLFRFLLLRKYLPAPQYLANAGAFLPAIFHSPILPQKTCLLWQTSLLCRNRQNSY